jgi:hypothetical protein
MNADPETLPAGDYAVTTLLGGLAVPNLSVDDAGIVTLESTQPPAIEGRTGYVFGLNPARTDATAAAPASPTA